jgi:Helix-turn-helix domain
MYAVRLLAQGVCGDRLAAVWDEGGSVNPPLLTLTPESLDAFVELVANLAVVKVEERTWPQWMDAKTAARYTSLPPKAITNRCEDGRLDARKVSGRWIIARAELDHYMERGRP